MNIHKNETSVTATLNENDLLNLAVLLRLGSEAWQKEHPNHDATADLKMANKFSDLHGELLSIRLKAEGRDNVAA
tara:strand:+ start:1228 stop:1452 length:225 start_codon:yes stop_codon:yes gene_type:complete